VGICWSTRQAKALRISAPQLQVRFNYSHDLPSFDGLCHRADNSMFRKVLHNSEHVLHSLLSPVSNTLHNLRKRAHDRVLPGNFIVRMLFYEAY